MASMAGPFLSDHSDHDCLGLSSAMSIILHHRRGPFNLLTQRAHVVEGQDGRDDGLAVGLADEFVDSDGFDVVACGKIDGFGNMR